MRLPGCRRQIATGGCRCLDSTRDISIRMAGDPGQSAISHRCPRHSKRSGSIRRSRPRISELVDENPVGLVYHSLLPNQYATSSSGGTCTAQGEAGRVDVTCDAPESGTLTVQENAFDGWHATVNGESVDIAGGQQWLSFEIPAGPSSIELRYQPWDFWIGLFASLLGIGRAAPCSLIPTDIDSIFPGIRVPARRTHRIPALISHFGGKSKPISRITNSGNDAHFDAWSID